MNQTYEGLYSLMSARDSLQQSKPEVANRILDVSFSKLCKNPKSVIKEIYDHFGYEFTPEYEQKIEEYIETHPRGQYGSVSYSLEEFNLSKETINNKFSTYIQRYSKYF